MRHFTLTHPCRLLVVLVSLLTLTACGKDKDNEPAQQDRLWQIESIRWGDTRMEYKYDHKGRVSSGYYLEDFEKGEFTFTYDRDIIRFGYPGEDGWAVSYLLDDYGRVISKKYTDAEPESFSYDNEGRMVFADHGYYTDEYEWNGSLIHKIVDRRRDGNVITFTFTYSNIDNVIGFNGVDDYSFMTLYRGCYGKLTAKLPSTVKIDATMPDHLSGSGFCSRTGVYSFHYTLDGRKRPTRIETKGPSGVNKWGNPYEDDPPEEITYVVK